MFYSLLGSNPQGYFLDSANDDEALKNSEIALNLIFEYQSGNLSEDEMVDWTLRAMDLLGKSVNQDDPDIQRLKDICEGKDPKLSNDLDLMLHEINVSCLNLDNHKDLDGDNSELAHKAISAWAELEVKDVQ